MRRPWHGARLGCIDSSIDRRRIQMLSSNRRTLALALALAAGSAPAALAGTQTLTKQQVIARGSAICRAAQHRVEVTPSPRSQDPFARTAPHGDRERAVRFIAVYASSLSSVRTGLRELVRAAPSQDRPLLASFVSQLGPTIAAFDAGHSAALAHRYTRAMSDVQRGFTLFARASVKTKAYGFPKGVCQAGA
jgi:hypothetical protein